MPCLVVQTGPETGKKYPLDDDRCVLGRHEDCDIRDLFVDTKTVSRRHASISQRDGQYFLEDLGSRRGTTLNGLPVNGVQLLKDGDEIGICGFVFLFEPEEVSWGRQTIGLAALLGDEKYANLLISQNDLVVVASIDTPSKPGEVAEKKGASSAEQRLKALIELLLAMGKSVDVQQVAENLLSGLFEIFPIADHGFVGVLDPTSGEVTPRATKYRSDSPDKRIPISTTLVERVMRSQQTVLSSNTGMDWDEELADSMANMKSRSFMCAPLIDANGKSLGIVQIDSPTEAGKFTQTDLEVLAALSPHAALLLQYSQWHAEAVRRHSLQRDLELARQVQIGLLPTSIPAVPGYEFFNHYQPAQLVGGDFYDYVPLPNNRMAIIVADVSGKGISAALLVAKLAGELRYRLSTSPSTAAALRRLNDSLCESNQTSHFVTLLAVVLNLQTHDIEIVNAGHLPPMHVTASCRVRPIVTSEIGMALGVFPDCHYSAVTVKLQANESLALFTDGITESMNLAGDLYGNERLIRRLSVKSATARDMGMHVLDDLDRFVDAADQADDICLVCLRRTGSG